MEQFGSGFEDLEEANHDVWEVEESDHEAQDAGVKF